MKLIKTKFFSKSNSATILRTVIYTIGHFFIAAACVMYFTGADLGPALTNAVVEPLINGVWYFVLDKYWASRVVVHSSDWPSDNLSNLHPYYSWLFENYYKE